MQRTLNCSQGIITIDRHGIVFTINLAAERILGYGINEVLEQNVKLLMPEPYKSGHDGYLHSYLCASCL